MGGNKSLCDAVVANNAHKVREALQKSADPNCMEISMERKGEGSVHREEVTCLYYAAAKKYDEIIALLISFGAEVNKEQKYRHLSNTALHAAAEAGSLSTCILLVKAGGSPFLRNSYSQFPSDVSGNGDCKQYLDVAATPGWKADYPFENGRFVIQPTQPKPFVQIVPSCESKLQKGIVIKVVEAHKLMPKDSSGASDPYVKLTIACYPMGSFEVKTKVLKKTLDPLWNEVFELPEEEHGKARFRPDNLMVTVQVYDKDLLSSEIEGRKQFRFDAHPLQITHNDNLGKTFRVTTHLEGKTARDILKSTITLEFTYIDRDRSNSLSQMKAQAMANMQRDLAMLQEKGRAINSLENELQRGSRAENPISKQVVHVDDVIRVLQPGHEVMVSENKGQSEELMESKIVVSVDQILGKVVVQANPKYDCVASHDVPVLVTVDVEQILLVDRSWPFERIKVGDFVAAKTGCFWHLEKVVGRSSAGIVFGKKEQTMNAEEFSIFGMFVIMPASRELRPDHPIYYHVSSMSNLEVLKTIVQSDPAVVNIPDSRGRNLMFRAIENHQLRLVEFLSQYIPPTQPMMRCIPAFTGDTAGDSEIAGVIDFLLSRGLVVDKELALRYPMKDNAKSEETQYRHNEQFYLYLFSNTQRSVVVRDDDVLVAWDKAQKFQHDLWNQSKKDIFCSIIKAYLSKGTELDQIVSFINDNYTLLICEESNELSILQGSKNKFFAPHLLCSVIAAGRTDVAIKLIEKGASVNSALDSAIRWCNLSVVNTLVKELGANINGLLPSHSLYGTNGQYSAMETAVECWHNCFGNVDAFTNQYFDKRTDKAENDKMIDFIYENATVTRGQFGTAYSELAQKFPANYVSDIEKDELGLQYPSSKEIIATATIEGEVIDLTDKLPKEVKSVVSTLNPFYKDFAATYSEESKVILQVTMVEFKTRIFFLSITLRRIIPGFSEYKNISFDRVAVSAPMLQIKYGSTYHSYVNTVLVVAFWKNNQTQNETANQCYVQPETIEFSVQV